jgi:hypothetical protein
MMNTKTQVSAVLGRLLGLQLAIARDAADMKVFHFGAIRPHGSGKGTVGQYALHVQCPWRIVGNDRILTGSRDFHEPPEENGEIDPENWQSGNLQLRRLGQLFQLPDPGTRSWINGTNQLLVAAIHCDDFGGVEVELSGGFRLQIFPTGSRAEDWRFFEPGKNQHLVVAAGQVTTQS